MIDAYGKTAVDSEVEPVTTKTRSSAPRRPRSSALGGNSGNARARRRPTSRVGQADVIASIPHGTPRADPPLPCHLVPPTATLVLEHGRSFQVPAPQAIRRGGWATSSRALRRTKRPSAKSRGSTGPNATAFSAAAADPDRRQTLTLYRGEHSMVVLNPLPVQQRSPARHAGASEGARPAFRRRASGHLRGLLPGPTAAS